MGSVTRLVVVLPLTPLTVGDSFAVHSWPLHVTVVPPFSTEAEPSVIAHALELVCAEHAAIQATAGNDTLFGRRENVAVTLIHESAALTRLHHRLVAAMLPLAAASASARPAVNEPGFRAHVTIKGTSRVYTGDVLTLGQVALVDMAPRAHASGRRVLATVSLRHPAHSASSAATAF